MRNYAAFAFAAALIGTPAWAYNVTISDAPTSNGTLSGGVFKATGPDAVLNYSELQNALAAGDVSVQTTAHGNQNGDIVVAHKIIWSANMLTLEAYHSIVVDSPMFPKALSALDLITNDGKNGGDLVLDGGRISFDSASQVLQIDTVPYMLMDGVGMMSTNMTGNPTGNFALAHSETEPTSFRGIPVDATFNGKFEGLGNTIDGLIIADSDHASLALITTVGSLATIRDLSFTNLTVADGMHAALSLAGLTLTNDGQISNVSIGGSVAGDYTDTNTIGGLVLRNNGRIVDCTSSATVSTDGPGTIGGLVELNSGTVTLSGTTGDVTGGGAATAGGLVGFNNGPVTLSFAKGHVASRGGTLGGLIGNNVGTVDQSFSTGDINSSGGGATDGGLVGSNSGQITNAYSRGAIVGQNSSTMGGFVGAALPNSQIAMSYSTGSTTGGTTMGGFIGNNQGGAAWAYWNTSTSNTMDATGSGSSDGISGYTSAQLRAGLPPGFDSCTWAEAPAVNLGFPYLINNPPSNPSSCNSARGR